MKNLLMLKIFAIFSKRLAKLIEFTLGKNICENFPFFRVGKTQIFLPQKRIPHAYCSIFRLLKIS
jgi:hypothetical protein